MTATINSQGIRLHLDDYGWLGSPATVDVIITGMDLLVLGGSTFPVQKHDNQAWVTTSSLRRESLIKGKYTLTREQAAGRYMCRLHDCTSMFHEGNKRLCPYLSPNPPSRD